MKDRFFAENMEIIGNNETVVSVMARYETGVHFPISGDALAKLSN